MGHPNSLREKRMMTTEQHVFWMPELPNIPLARFSRFKQKMEARSALMGACSRITALGLLLLVCRQPLAYGQGSGAPIPVFGGSYKSLAPQQQELVNKWFAEYEKITGNQLDPETSYDTLRPSVRTTFEAVTHALMKSRLTAPNGESLGNALSLVKLVESVHGEIPSARGDQQFRVYVLLTDDAVDKLYKAVEFKRIGDNSIYHIGYPINFRQQGGMPSIQFSVTRTGLRADIDVDYRSSSGPMALVNGHLTAANSDVRAGGNYFRHTKRWTGFGDWWKSIFSAPSAIPKADQEALSSQYRKPHVTGSQNVEAAVHDFYQSWLVEGRPQESLSYISVKANACVAEYGKGQSARSGMIQLRVYQHMKQMNKILGKVDNLDDVMHGAVVLGKGTQPVQQLYGKLFAIAQIPGDLARSLDCRKTLGAPLVEDLPAASHALGQYFSSSTVVRPKDGQGPGQFLYYIWTREEGTWKIVSWYLENPFELPLEITTHTAAASPAPSAEAVHRNPELARAVHILLEDWLIKRDFSAAAGFFAPEALACAPLEMGSDKKGQRTSNAGLLQTWLEQVAKAIPDKDKLGEEIQTVAFDPNQKEEVQHPHAESYLLLRVSDDLARMSSCSFRESGRAVSRGTSTGEPTFQLNTYQSVFEPKHREGDRGAVVLTWAQRNNRWVVVAFAVEHY